VNAAQGAENSTLRGGKMLKSLTVKCYKPFGMGGLKPGAVSEIQTRFATLSKAWPLSDYEGEKLEIRPVTVLLGANSISKTSLLDLILALQQTAVYADATQSRSSALRLNGKIVSLGDVKSLFHLNNISDPVGLIFEIDNSKRFASYADDFRKVLLETLALTESVFNIAKKEIGPALGADSLTVQEMVNLNTQYSRILDSDPELSQLLLKSALTPGRGRPLYTEQDLSLSSRLIDALYHTDLECTPTTLDLSIAFDKEKTNLFVKRCAILVGDRKILSFRFGANHPGGEDRNLFDLSSHLVDSSKLANYEKSLEKMLQPDKPIFRFAYRGDRERPGFYFTELCWRVVRSTIAELKELFSSNAIGHIDADRGAPRRYYFTDPANEESLQKAGFISILQEDETVRTAVDGWMKNFSLKVRAVQGCRV
jgi:hypothetical protein